MARCSSEPGPSNWIWFFQILSLYGKFVFAFLVVKFAFMRILVVGGSGMLGQKLVQRWRDYFDVWTTLRSKFADYERFGIFQREKTIESLSALDTAAVATTVERIRPDVIFNAVGIVKQVPSAR